MEVNDLDLLEMEIKLMQDCINRVREFQRECKELHWEQCNSLVVGELKHRAVAMKQTLVKINRKSTIDFNN